MEVFWCFNPNRKRDQTKRISKVLKLFGLLILAILFSISSDLIIFHYNRMKRPLKRMMLSPFMSLIDFFAILTLGTAKEH